MRSKWLLQDLFDTQALVLGQRKVTDLVAVDELLGALDERLEEVDSMALVRRQVGMALDGQKVEPTAAVRWSFDTYTSRLDRYLAANICAVTC